MNRNRVLVALALGAEDLHPAAPHDEIRGARFGGERIVLGPEVAARTITLMSPSKTYNIAGLGAAFAVAEIRRHRGHAAHHHDQRGEQQAEQQQHDDHRVRVGPRCGLGAHVVGDVQRDVGILLDQKKVADRIREISDQYGLEVDPEAYIKDLPVGIQQRVEIIKLLYRNADIFILDEPTAGVDPVARGRVGSAIHSLQEPGLRPP